MGHRRRRKKHEIPQATKARQEEAVAVTQGEKGDQAAKEARR
jgi:hypothetical protein